MRSICSGLLLAGILLGTSCSEESGGAVDAGPVADVGDAGHGGDAGLEASGPTWTEFCEQYRQIKIDRALECRDAMPPEGFARLIELQGPCPEPRPNIHYDRTAAAECLDALRTEPCYRYVAREPEACRRVEAGTLAPGAECRESRECAGGLCTADVDPFLCPGLCFAYAEEGAACKMLDHWQYPHDCAPGFGCVNDVCVASPIGDAKEEGETCSGDECASGLVCISGVCTGIREGNPCDSANDCGEWPACMTDDCFDCVEHKCVFTSGKMFGEQCQPHECALPYLFCGNDGTCQIAGEIGSPCGMAGPAQVAICLWGRCEQPDPSTMWSCVALAAPGEPCAADFDCDPYESLRCDPASNTCQAYCRAQ